jgi:hypothetical protein
MIMMGGVGGVGRAVIFRWQKIVENRSGTHCSGTKKNICARVGEELPVS